MATSNIVTVGPDALKLLGTLVYGGLGITGGIAGTLLGIALILDGIFGLSMGWLLSSGWVILAATGALVLCCSGPIFLAAVIWRRPRVEIGPEGFVARNAFGSRSRRWSDIEGSFVVIKVGLSKSVGYRLARVFKESARIKPSTLFAGNDEVIGGAYDIPIGKLAELLNQYKERASVVA
jgi:hypothetical protein